MKTLSEASPVFPNDRPLTPWITFVACLLVCALSPPAVGQGALSPSPLAEMMTLRDWKTGRISSYDRTGGNTDWIVIEPGETFSLAKFEGKGCVKHIYWTYIFADEPRRNRLFRDVILRMYWDGEETPSVECPIGDFFGVSNCAPRPIESLLLVTNPGTGAKDESWGFNCYFPMPFSEGARLEVTNEADDTLGFWYHIDYETYPEKVDWLDEVGRFHAQFRRVVPTARILPNAENKDGADNYVILEATGQGNVAGYMLEVENVRGGWWGEGDDMVFVDGEIWPPSYHGTGTEEIFGGGAGPDVEYSGPYTGFHLVENRQKDSWYGRNAMYRFFVQDPIRFKKSIRVTIEHGHANDLPNPYSSVAYWYQREPHGKFPPLPSSEERAIAEYPPVTKVEGAIEAEDLLETAKTSGAPLLAWRFPGFWSAGRFLWYIAGATDEFVTLTVPVESEGTYEVEMYLTKASDFGAFQLDIDGENVGAPFDAYNENGGVGSTHLDRSEKVAFGSVHLEAGTHAFEFRVVSRNEAATSYMIGVDCILLRKNG